jgi:hypothetical protein
MAAPVFESVKEGGKPQRITVHFEKLKYVSNG